MRFCLFRSLGSSINVLVVRKRNMAQFSISKIDSMADEFIDISLKGAPRSEEITLRAQTVIDSNRRFSSIGYHLSDVDGTIHLPSNPSFGGTYNDVNPMGLISTLTPDSDQRRGLRFLPKTTDPITVRLSAYLGHVDDFSNVHSIADMDIRRHYVSENVTCTPLKHGRLRGLLFTPKNIKGKVPAILDVYGSGGGVMPLRAALLASKGFVTMSLAYFRYEDLPKTLRIVELEYFLEAVEYLRSLDEVDPQKVGAIALSLGTDFLIQAAALTPHIKAVVLINGLPASMVCKSSWKGRVLEPSGMDLGKISECEEGNVIFRDCYVLDDLGATDILPIQKVSGKILLVASEEDTNVPAVKSANILAAQLDSFGRSRDYRLVTYEGAGHLLEPAYMPFCDAMYMPHFSGIVSSMGGIRHLHEKAQIRFWMLIVNFFKRCFEDDGKNVFPKL